MSGKTEGFLVLLGMYEASICVQSRHWGENGGLDFLLLALSALTGRWPTLYSWHISSGARVSPNRPPVCAVGGIMEFLIKFSRYFLLAKMQLGLTQRPMPAKIGVLRGNPQSLCACIMNRWIFKETHPGTTKEFMKLNTYTYIPRYACMHVYVYCLYGINGSNLITEIKA